MPRISLDALPKNEGMPPKPLCAAGKRADSGPERLPLPNPYLERAPEEPAKRVKRVHGREREDRGQLLDAYVDAQRKGEALDDEMKSLALFASSPSRWSLCSAL